MTTNVKLRYFMLLSFLLIAGCEQQNQKPSSTIESHKPVVKDDLITYNITKTKAWDSFYNQGISLKTSEKEVSKNSDGTICEISNSINGELRICNFNENVTEIYFHYLGQDKHISEKIANAFINFFDAPEMPYTIKDKSRIIREFNEYTNEKPPLKFPNRWIAINGKFIKVDRLISSNNSGFEVNASPVETP